MRQLSVERRSPGTVPWVLLGVTLLTAGVGVYNLVSASRAGAQVWQSQILYVCVGVGVVVTLGLLSARVVQSLVIPVYVLNIAALIALKFFGHTAKAQRAGFVVGPFRVQPAEFMKIGMVLMLARWFNDEHQAQKPNPGFLRLIVPSVIALVPTVLVLAQPDLGTALMMAFTTITIIFFSRPTWPVWVVAGVMFLSGIGVLWNDYVRVQPEPRFTIVRHKLKKHQDARITSWLDPMSDLKGSSYHAMQSKIAVGSGGMNGKGWKSGTQTGLRYLPEQHTDFIFSVWAEEQGFVRCVLLLALYAAMLLGALGVALTAKERFGAFLAVGIAAMIFWQVFENIGMVTGLLPITGITLPLMSYGGSSMLSVMIGIGLLVNTARRKGTTSR